MVFEFSWQNRNSKSSRRLYFGDGSSLIIFIAITFDGTGIIKENRMLDMALFSSFFIIIFVRCGVVNDVVNAEVECLSVADIERAGTADGYAS